VGGCADVSATRLRAGFVMEQVLGHISHYDTLRRVVERDSDEIDPRWIEVTYAGNGRVERLRQLPESVRGTLRGFLQVREGLKRGPLDAVLFHTQKPAVFQWGLMLHTPSVLSLDVTPLQYDQLGEFYDHVPDGDTLTAKLKHWINVRTFALAKRIVVWSQWVKDSLVADYGVPPDKVQVIPPGVDLSLWTVPPDRDDDPARVPRVLLWAEISSARADRCCSTGFGSTAAIGASWISSLESTCLKKSACAFTAVSWGTARLHASCSRRPMRLSCPAWASASGSPPLKPWPPVCRW
jgi:hypothetical protein